MAEGLFADTAGLYWSFTSPARIKGVAVAKVHKILHLKRPGLYPKACWTRMADDDETVRLMGTLTCLRLQDMIAWMIAAGHAQA